VPGQAGEIAEPRTSFDRFAEATSRFVSQAAFFVIAVILVILVIVWVPTIAVFQSVDTWQLVLNTVTSVLAFLLIALLQNSERRYDLALHRKVDALVASLTLLVRYELKLRGQSEDLEQALAHLDAVQAQQDTLKGSQPKRNRSGPASRAERRARPARAPTGVRRIAGGNRSRP
jgi:low affinity Fe/Cu permease